MLQCYTKIKYLYPKLAFDLLFCSCRSLESQVKISEILILQAMVATYPGDGTGYKRHIDNTGKDGRALSVLYYLNKGWQSEVSLKENCDFVFQILFETFFLDFSVNHRACNISHSTILLSYSRVKLSKKLFVLFYVPFSLWVFNRIILIKSVSS